MSWSNNEDFRKDLYAYSENQTSPNDEPEPLPITIAQWNALNGVNREQSIYDTIPFENDVTLISSGRGRGRPSELFRPGAPLSYGSTNEDDEIRRRLQEVNSQSYSNANIESTIKMKSRTPINLFCDAKEQIPNRGSSPRENLSEPIIESSSSSSSPIVIDEIEKKTVLPLSQMRQNAKQKPKQKLYSQVLKDKIESKP